MRRITINEAALLLQENDNFRLLTHSYPDGDTLGGAFALCFALRKMGKNCNVSVDGKLPSKFQYLVKNYEDQKFTPEYIVSVDIAAMPLISKSVMADAKKIDLCIDHHGTNTIEADNLFIDATAAAASESVYQIIRLLEVALDEDIAAGVYTGISTDTGCFCYSNTTMRTHRIAAEVMPYCNWREINNINFMIKSRAKIKMERMIYDTMEFYAGGRCAIVYTTLSMQEAIGAGDDEMEGLASIPRQIEGVKMGITMREKADGAFKISVRTNDGIDAAKFCQQFGGGGHAAAAGCSIQGDLATVKKRLVDAAEETL